MNENQLQMLLEAVQDYSNKFDDELVNNDLNSLKRQIMPIVKMVNNRGEKSLKL